VLGHRRSDVGVMVLNRDDRKPQLLGVLRSAGPMSVVRRGSARSRRSPVPVERLGTPPSPPRSPGRRRCDRNVAAHPPGRTRCSSAPRRDRPAPAPRARAPTANDRLGARPRAVVRPIHTTGSSYRAAMSRSAARRRPRSRPGG
jgi:hypothetical protein